jgi:hypothetical protein
MYIRTASGEWRPLWSLPQPSIQEVRDRLVWLTSPNASSLAERTAFETRQHLALLTLRERNDRARDTALAKKTGIKLAAQAA